MDISIIGDWGAIGRQTAISLVHNRVLDASSRLQLVGRRGGEAERALVGFASDLQDAYAESIPELDVVFDADDVLGDIISFAAGATVPTNAKERLPRLKPRGIRRCGVHQGSSTASRHRYGRVSRHASVSSRNRERAWDPSSSRTRVGIGRTRSAPGALLEYRIGIWFRLA
jgi:hypothetical protein